MVCGESPSKRIENLNKMLSVIENSISSKDVLSDKQIFGFDEDLFMYSI